VPTRDAFPPEAVARARKLYAESSVPLSRILAEIGMTRSDLYHFVDGAGGTLPPLPRRGRSAGGRRSRPSGDRAGLVKRIWRTAERQVRDIEERVLRNQDQQPGERADDARTLAVLIKALRELSALDERKGAKDNDLTHDDGPRDIDEFRRELARKMDAFIESRTGAGVSNVPGD
jgi:hypothetical protein